jgi:hypothetical protein
MNENNWKSLCMFMCGCSVGALIIALITTI